MFKIAKLSDDVINEGKTNMGAWQPVCSTNSLFSDLILRNASAALSSKRVFADIENVPRAKTPD